MSHIYIYSPSSAVRDRKAARRGIARLKALGHEVEIDEDAFATHMRFAGDDATRLAAIHRACASGADIALITRGGYGLTRLLPQIRTKAVARAVERGTHFVGLSDFTAFQGAVMASTGATTWAGPALGEDFGVEGDADEIMLACFDDLALGQAEGSGWQLPRSEARDRLLHTRGTLWGGNLSVLTSLLGTPYMPQPQAGILFLEDVHEHPYRVERMLTQLLHAGVLARQKAILLGQFTNYRLAPHDKGYKLQTVVDWLRAQVKKVPVFTNLPFGHVTTKVLLPVGSEVELAVEGRDALIVWGHRH
ncbi:LD-carboxypeptidase [Ramlibacter sp. AN1015]|uniref:LD-carboxypeptidase n=1 Tax=Ramlibacter sp. AN1015 TaxID=3133428 RepID=UPI0030BACD09